MQHLLYVIFRSFEVCHSKSYCEYTSFTATQRGTSARLMQKAVRKALKNGQDGQARGISQYAEHKAQRQSSTGILLQDLAQIVIINILYSREWRPRLKVLELQLQISQFYKLFLCTKVSDSLFTLLRQFSNNKCYD